MGETQSNNNLNNTNNTNNINNNPPPKSESEESYIKSFIPQKISNSIALSFFELLRKINYISNNFSGNLENNNINFEHHKKRIKKDNGYIENQHDYDDMKYGNQTMSYCGCEVISVHNANNYLKDKNTNLPEIINDFEKDGITLNGNFGTAPKAIEDYYKKNNYITESTSKEEEFDKILQKSDCGIFTFYNNKDDIMDQVHTVSMTKE